MSGIQCPRCGREASGGGRFWRDGKPFCPTCGWNVDRAQTLRGQNQMLAAAYFVVVGIFLGLLGAFARPSSEHRRSFAIFAVFVVGLVFISWFRKNWRNTLPPSGPSAASSPPVTLAGEVANSASASYERLRMLRRPRAIRMKTSMRIFVTVYLIVFAGVAYAIFLTVDRGAKGQLKSLLPNALPLALFGLVWSIVAFTMFRSVVRDRSLLTDGEIAIGTVTAQFYSGGESRESKIEYQFKDGGGRVFSGKCADKTRKLFEEMQTPVFYDPMNPAKNVALAGATYDVVES
jgi:hypothetical protein